MPVSYRTELAIRFAPMIVLLVASMATCFAILITGEAQPWTNITTSLDSAAIAWAIGGWYFMRERSR